MIDKCSKCGRKRKLYRAIGKTINALMCAECIAKYRQALTRIYEPDATTTIESG